MGCRRSLPQAELVRFHLAGERLEIDSSRDRAPGRGAYLCAKMECWRSALKRRSFQKALRTGAAGLDQGGLGEALEGIIASSPQSGAREGFGKEERR